MCVRGEGESRIEIASIVKRYYQGHIDSKEKRACNLVPIKILTDAKNSNKLCIIYVTILRQLMLLKIVPFYCWFEFCYLY